MTETVAPILALTHPHVPTPLARAGLGRPRRRRGRRAASNPNVVRYYAEVGHAAVTDDAVAWCAAFLGACLERADIGSTRSLLARSYLSWGEALSEERHGAIAVLSRGSDPALGHVGFLVGTTPNDLILLGGNQGDAVSVQPFPRSRLLGLRWPATQPALHPPRLSSRKPRANAPGLSGTQPLPIPYSNKPSRMC